MLHPPRTGAIRRDQAPWALLGFRLTRVRADRYRKGMDGWDVIPAPVWPARDGAERR